MNNKQFTDELFKRMYDLGFRKAEIEDDVLFFFCGEREFLNPFLPRVMVASTCFEEKDRLIDIAEYLGIVDWSKVEVDTPILVKHRVEETWEKRHFACFKNGYVYTWREGTTSWSVPDEQLITMWNYAKLAEV
jgi:hypothetical protein